MPNTSFPMARRLLHFVALVSILTALMFTSWVISRAVLPQRFLAPYFSSLFLARVGELAWWRIFLANILPFLVIHFMNLYRVRGIPGGMYVLPIFWALLGVIYGTNSFIFPGQPIALSLSVVWQRTGVSELAAYTFGYEASRFWQLWEGAWNPRRIPASRWAISRADSVFLIAGLLALLFSASRESS